MPNLLEKLTNSRRVEPERLEPRFSRKTRLITVTVHIDEIPIEFSILIRRLDKAIDRACSYADGSGPLQRLFEELLHARQKYGHIIDGNKKRRGSQSGRQGVSYDLQYAAAWTYCFIRYQWKRPKKN